MGWGWVDVMALRWRRIYFMDEGGNCLGVGGRMTRNG
jgi:hypothetical protein